LYKRLYLQIAWRLSGENDYRLRLAHVASEEQMTAKLPQIEDLEAQRLTPYDRLSDEAVAAIECPEQQPLDAHLLESIQRERGWSDWVAAVRRFQQLHTAGAYSIVFFVNVAPLECRARDVFFDGGSAALNRFALGYLRNGTPAVSSYDTFRRLRPSQMPFVSGHALGNANGVKADVLFEFLSGEVLADAPRLHGPAPPR
jgi:hypothetical protein